MMLSIFIEFAPFAWAEIFLDGDLMWICECNALSEAYQQINIKIRCRQQE